MDCAEALSFFCRKVRERGVRVADVTDVASAETRLILSALFYEDVRSGGFAKWVYNANGVYLPETVEVFTLLGAGSTNAIVDRVLNHCVEQHDAYQAFLEGDFSDCAFKDVLNTLTEEYRQSPEPLEVEAKEPLLKLAKELRVI